MIELLMGLFPHAYKKDRGIEIRSLGAKVQISPIYEHFLLYANLPLFPGCDSSLICKSLADLYGVCLFLREKLDHVYACKRKTEVWCSDGTNWRLLGSLFYVTPNLAIHWGPNQKFPPDPERTLHSAQKICVLGEKLLRDHWIHDRQGAYYSRHLKFESRTVGDNFEEALRLEAKFYGSEYDAA